MFLGSLGSAMSRVTRRTPNVTALTSSRRADRRGYEMNVVGGDAAANRSRWRPVAAIA
jgi:hypothetical protein